MRIRILALVTALAGSVLAGLALAPASASPTALPTSLNSRLNAAISEFCALEDCRASFTELVVFKNGQFVSGSKLSQVQTLDLTGPGPAKLHYDLGRMDLFMDSGLKGDYAYLRLRPAFVYSDPQLTSTEKAAIVEAARAYRLGPNPFTRFSFEEFFNRFPALTSNPGFEGIDLATPHQFVLVEDDRLDYQPNRLGGDTFTYWMESSPVRFNGKKAVPHLVYVLDRFDRVVRFEVHLGTELVAWSTVSYTRQEVDMPPAVDSLDLPFPPLPNDMVE